jgi:hypothetical protein
MGCLKNLQKLHPRNKFGFQNLIISRTHLTIYQTSSNMSFLKQTKVIQFTEVVKVEVGFLEGPDMDVELNRFKSQHGTRLEHDFHRWLLQDRGSGLPGAGHPFREE